VDEKGKFIDSRTEKICTCCGELKPAAEFYILGNGKLFSWCAECHRTTNRNKARDLKIKCVEYKGGKCEVCGYSHCLGALEFHHLDPEQKDFTISTKQLTANFEKLKPELDKCSLLCKNCHAEVHYQENN
jgi:hypothetical protein